MNKGVGHTVKKFYDSKINKMIGTHILYFEIAHCQILQQFTKQCSIFWMNVLLFFSILATKNSCRS